VQAADVRLGMINIRSDDDLAPEEVLETMSPEEEAQVRKLAPPLSDHFRLIGAPLSHKTYTL
jgi:hypothetical protein